MNEWREMSTAPMTGEPVLLCLAKPISSNALDSYVPFDAIQVVIGWWLGRWEICFMEEGTADTEGHSSNFYMGAIFGLPTEPVGWMPLPTPQQEKTDEQD